MATTRYIVRETDNLWSRLREIARNEFFELYFDKTDTLHYKKHPMYAAVLPNPVMTFDEDFCIEPLIVEDRASQRVRQVILRAVTDGGDTLYSEYPASPTYVYGKVEDSLRSVRCNAQNVLDDWSDRMYNFLNRDYTVKWTAPGLCGLLFEILDRVEITYTGTAYNGAHIDWTEKKFWIHEIDVIPDNSTFGGHTVFTLEAEST
jgi:hypothetical protein